MGEQISGRGQGAVDHPFLAFVNTVSDSGKTRLDNTFTDASDLHRLLRDAGLDLPDLQPCESQLSPILRFREAAYGALSARAGHRPLRGQDAQILDATLKSAVAGGQFVFSVDGLRVDPNPFGGVLDILALALMDLMMSPDFARLTECRRCTKLFINRGRGRGRRWCDMARCGNRAKAESFRARQRAARLA